MSPAWGPDSRQLFFSDSNFLQVAELRTTPSVAVAGRRIVTRLPHIIKEFDLSPDGKTFAVVASAGKESDVLVAVNWSDDLRRSWQQNARPNDTR
jgi:hypothetical protein